MIGLQKRLHIAFVQALALVLIIGGVSLYYLQRLDKELRFTLSQHFNALQASEVSRDGFEDLAKALNDKNLSLHKMNEQFTEKLAFLKETVTDAKQAAISEKNIERYKKSIEEAEAYLGAIRSLQQKPEESDRYFEENGIKLVDSIRGNIGAIINSRYHELQAYRGEIQLLLERTQRNLILILILVAGGGIALAFLTPIRVVWPFRKMFAAFNEAQAGNLSVRLPVTGEGEINEMVRSFNSLMFQIEELDDMKTKKIQFMHRRFETLANIVDAAVVLINVEGEILFLNAASYRVFGLTSQQVAGKDVRDLKIPEEVKSLLGEVIDHKARIEDREWCFMLPDEDGAGVKKCCVHLDAFPISRYTGEVVNMLVVFEERTTPNEQRVFRRHLD
ncbi:MAG: hypothetical protein COV43_07190 [Deltaproteobacteria bacterium CG11_big_fil_rev_8_21_14_0_20_42_23]|nr:MAG: hypothetical protein COV43_07190 [Deltaproteobacteria bacterium CG11_big_fil_rev_8_21_14_0_20_42_23]PJC64180.1 MAG: hypothetical protein CO021_05555 [Deltaproteobacteria bacterium CG_4_9_14_0_2_um_filter_42_21]